MKPTHLFAGQFPVAVEPRDDHTVWLTYVGPHVPGNRKLGERRLASRTNFDGKPMLEPISR